VQYGGTGNQPTKPLKSYRITSYTRPTSEVPNGVNISSAPSRKLFTLQRGGLFIRIGALPVVPEGAGAHALTMYGSMGRIDHVGVFFFPLEGGLVVVTISFSSEGA